MDRRDVEYRAHDRGSLNLREEVDGHGREPVARVPLGLPGGEANWHLDAEPEDAVLADVDRTHLRNDDEVTDRRRVTGEGREVAPGGISAPHYDRIHGENDGEVDVLETDDTADIDPDLRLQHFADEFSVGERSVPQGEGLVRDVDRESAPELEQLKGSGRRGHGHTGASRVEPGVLGVQRERIVLRPCRRSRQRDEK